MDTITVIDSNAHTKITPSEIIIHLAMIGIGGIIPTVFIKN